MERRQSARRLFAAVAAIMFVATVVPAMSAGADVEPLASVLPGPCPPEAPVVTFDVTALPIPISYNHWGDMDVRGQQYVLDAHRDALLDEVGGKLIRAGLGPLGGDVLAMRDAFRAYDISGATAAAARLTERTGGLASLGTPQERVDVSALQRPLVLRAHLGDCVHVRLTNVLPQAASIHIHDVVSPPGAGAVVGANAPDVTAPGDTSVYRVYVPPYAGMEGGHYLHSHADARDQTRHGLFGMLVAEPQGAVWTPEDRTDVWAEGDLNAIIAVPGAPDFREFIMIYHDEVELVNWQLTPLPTVSPYGEYGPGTKAISLRSEPFYDRFAYHDSLYGSPGVERAHDKSQSYGSYTYGDPGTQIQRSYLGDPAKTRLANAGPGQYHIHHLHGGGIRWKATPMAEASQIAIGLVKNKDGLENVDNPASQRLDVINVGPGEAFSLETEGGSGGVQGSVGDFLYHCHIAEHYLAGMWSFWRVYNTLQPDLAQLPDQAAQGRPAVLPAVSSAELIGTTVAGNNAITEENIEAWVQSQLPAQGVPGVEDASVWDWIVDEDHVYYGEPETTHVWPNYASPTPGERPVLGFDPRTGKLAYPHLKPHFGERPPFAPGHGPTPYLKHEATPSNPDGLCVDNSRRLQYDMVAIEAPVKYNQFDTDDQGQVFVRAMDRAANQAEDAEPTSIVLRANAGDCVDLTLVNALHEKDEASLGIHMKTNIHIHLVQFDVQASDGVVAGFNYETTLRSIDGSHTTDAMVDPSAPTVATILSDVEVGDAVIEVSEVAVFRDAMGDVKDGSLVGFGLGLDTIESAKLVSVSGTSGPGTITLSSPAAKAHEAGEKIGYEFVRYAWYPDVELGTVYFHDHVNGLDTWRHGLFGSLIVEPRDSKWLSPTRVNDSEADGDVAAGPNAVAHVVDIVKDGESFRELVLHFQDRGCVSPAEGDDCIEFGGPEMPDRIDEPAAFNLRSAPLHRRNADQPFSSAARWGVDATGQASSDDVQGDPETDILHAYPGDKVMVRMLYAGQSASRGVGTFALTGHRFQIEKDLPGGRTVGAFSMAESTMSNLVLEGGAGGIGQLPGDYMYYMAQPEYLDRGAWGLLRVHDYEAGDRPIVTLDSNDAPQAGALDDLPVRYYDVAAVRGLVTNNPSMGISALTDRFVLLQDAFLAQQPSIVPPDPLVMRARPGEIVQINLTNMLPNQRVGMGASMLSGSTGFDLGQNADETVAPTQTGVFRWHIDAEVGVVDLVSLANPQQAGAGLVAALVVEPWGSEWDDDNGATTIVHLAPSPEFPSGKDVHEHVLMFASEDSQFQSSTMPYAPDVAGLSTVNFATEPITRRVGGAQVPATEQFGGPTGAIGGAGVGTCQIEPQNCATVPFDIRNPFNPFGTSGALPWTPIVQVDAGQAVVLRLMGGSGDQLQAIHVDGHAWAVDWEMDRCRFDLDECGSNIVSTVTVGPREVHNVWIPAAGPGGAGDYLYREHRDAFFEAGVWGLMRVS